MNAIFVRTEDKNKLEEISILARKKSRQLQSLSNKIRNDILLKIASTIEKKHAEIQEANNLDQEQYKESFSNRELFNRMVLDDSKIRQLALYPREVQKMEDPLGILQKKVEIDKDLILERRSCAIGVIAVIYESRPEVTIQVASLAIKSGNGLLLKGGKECKNTNQKLFECINEVLCEYELTGIVSLLYNREDISSIFKLRESIDLIIPRGSKQLVEYVQQNTNIPVIGHTEGICHIYVDSDIDKDEVIKIILDSKIEYPAACNAVETVLIHKDSINILSELLVQLKKKNVEVRVSRELAYFSEKMGCSFNTVQENDWKIEYNDLIVAIKLVSTIEEAIEHINFYGSHHTDSILTNDSDNVRKFFNNVDSACVFHNSSTRFSDGYVFGLGAEIGISTSKIHARGPVGLEGMLTYKYFLKGKNHTKSQYHKKYFKHKTII